MRTFLAAVLAIGAFLFAVLMVSHYWSPPPSFSNGHDMSQLPTLIRLGNPRSSDLNGPGSSVDNHPTGAKFYQRDWQRGDLGTVQFVSGNHSFVIDNVLSMIGFAAENVPEGIYRWNISFGVSPEQADTHEAARDRVMKLLAQLRASGWKRYVDVGDPRLQGRAAWHYGASFPVAVYSLDPEYPPTQDEWNAMLRHTPRWILYGDGAYLTLSVMESNMGGFVGKSTYLLTVDVKSEYAFYGLGYFPGNAEKIHNWKALLPAELEKYHAMRLKTEAALRAQGYAIDTTYQDPPIKALQSSSASAN
ncbi:hypothetical protein [Paraburkholderia caledonica]|uniref:Uncharacterized protein n=1 Tax=Paraburkholderia caledonica TaxID=134536 RepID=A0ABU1L393_9BURK|nr:hypothetical protein [Paraburkholderia caledonica]MDR6377625.1 hypothetical protein [Paraburkholderia caledonica]